jgi:short-subunit dehydrogenase
MKKYAIITGASSGIGRELAYIHARNGHDLLLIARREKQLSSLKEKLESEF